MDESHTFNLKPLSERAASAVRGFRWMMMAVAAILGLLAVLIALVNISRHTFFQNFAVTYGAAYIGLSIVTAVMSWVTYQTRPGAVSLEVDSKELRFRWASGKIESLRWDSPRTRLILYDYSSDPVDSAPFRGIRRPGGPKTVIPPEAFEEVLARARDHRLHIVEVPPGVAWYGSYPCRIEIRGEPQPAGG